MNNARVRRTARTLGTLIATIAMASALAPAALAVGSLVDNGNGTITAMGVNGSGANGLWICSTATAAASCTGSNYDYGNHFTSGVYQVGSQVYTPTSPGMVSLPAGTYNIQLVDAPNGSTTLTNVSIGAAPANSGAASPASILQAFAGPTSGTCDDAASPLLNWAGVESGSWGRSWQQWVNDGNGGAVCQRTLSYSSNLGRWTIAR